MAYFEDDFAMIVSFIYERYEECNIYDYINILTYLIVLCI